MAAPPKPWERAGINSQQSTGIGTGTALPPFADQMSSGPFTGSSYGGGAVPRTATSTVTRAAPPPVPTRNTIARAPPQSGYGGSMYGSGYGNYGGFGYGGGLGYGGGSYGGMYGGYGGGMYGMNRFGGGLGGMEGEMGGFAQHAELSSRAAFQSIESVVGAFGSVAMMLDSTFQAVYNSFRAVVGVADHMSRVRASLARIFSALAIWRTLRWIYRQLLVLLRLRQASPNGATDDVWTEAVAQAGTEVNELTGLAGGADGAGGKSWPIMLFFAIVVGAPWLLWKLLSSLAGQKDGGSGWVTGVDDHFLAVAEYDFSSESADELSFRQGVRIIVAPKELQPRVRGWLLATVNGKKTGLVPANYIKLLGRRRGTRYTTPASASAQPSLAPSSLSLPPPNSSLAPPSSSFIPPPYSVVAPTSTLPTSYPTSQVTTSASAALENEFNSAAFEDSFNSGMTPRIELDTFGAGNDGVVPNIYEEFDRITDADHERSSQE